MSDSIPKRRGTPKLDAASAAQLYSHYNVVWTAAVVAACGVGVVIVAIVEWLR